MYYKPLLNPDVDESRLKAFNVIYFAALKFFTSESFLVLVLLHFPKPKSRAEDCPRYTAFVMCRTG